MKRTLTAALVIGAAWPWAASPARAQTGASCVQFGPQTYVRGSGAPATVTHTFSVPNPSAPAFIRVANGGNGQFPLVSSAVITLNGTQVVGADAFNQNVTQLQVLVALQKVNTIAVRLASKPGSGFVLQVRQIDNDPPTVVGVILPPPNNNGWNNTDVTVGFQCTDLTCAVASCPTPITLTTEGANESVSGTATDTAGNSATTRVVVNIDKTPPRINASVSPPPNARGCSTTPVTVTYACADALSGVVSCPSAVTVFPTNGDQVLDETISDEAGNSATTSTAVSFTHPLDSIDGSAHPALVPDTTAYDFFLRSLVLPPSAAPGQIARVQNAFASMGLSPSDATQLTAIANSWKATSGGLDAQAATILKGNAPDAFSRLLQLDVQRRILLDQLIASLPSSLGSPLSTALSVYVHANVNRKIKFARRTPSAPCP